MHERAKRTTPPAARNQQAQPESQRASNPTWAQLATIVQRKCERCEDEQRDEQADEAAATPTRHAVQHAPAGDPHDDDDHHHPVQQQCSVCTAEATQGVSEPVQLWDCHEYGEPTCVQSKDDENVDEDAGFVQLWDCHEYGEPTCVQAKCDSCEEEPASPLQRQHDGSSRAARIHHEARRGLAGASQALPFGAHIQRAFGRHDISGVRARVGGEAAQASRRMGALAFTSGSRIGFRDTPDLRLAVHEAAHTVQQRAGLSLPGKVGRAGDRWERHADQVADEVVAGRSAEPLLDQVAGGSTPTQPAVQHRPTASPSRLIEPPLAGESEAPPSSESPAPESNAPPTSDAGTEHAAGENQSTLEAANGGEHETPPEGTTPSGGASGEAATPPAAPTPPGAPAPNAGAADLAAPAGPAGAGGVSAPCYAVDPPPPPDNSPPPAADNRGTQAQQQTQVTFDAWKDEPDKCQAEATVAQGSHGVSASAQSVTASPSTPPAAERASPAAAPAPAGGAAAGGPAPAAAAGGGQSTMSGPIAAAESDRAAAIDQFEQASGSLADVSARAGRLRQGVRLEPRGGEALDRDKRDAAMGQVRGFMDRSAEQIYSAIAFASGEVPSRLGGLAQSAIAQLQIAIEMEKAAISERIAQARSPAIAGAAAARAHVDAQYVITLALAEAQTTLAIAAIDQEYASSGDSVHEKETNALGDVNSRFVAGRRTHEAKGPEYSRRAIERGQTHAHAYETNCKAGYRDDGPWKGCLTVRRARAQQDAACKTAAGYKEGFLRTANKKGFDLQPVRTQYRCAVISGARAVNRTLDDTHTQVIAGLERGFEQARAGLQTARAQNLAAIDSALSATLSSLRTQEHAQRQAVNDAGYLKQLALEQLAHSGAANLALGISSAMDTLEGVLAQLRDRLAGNGIPDPQELALDLARVEGSLGGGMGSLLAQMQGGAAQSEGQLSALANASMAALQDITSKNAEQTASGEQSFATQMTALQGAATQAFNQLGQNHTQQAQQASSEGVASMQRAVQGFDSAIATIGARVDAAIASSLAELDLDLQNQYNGLDRRIASEAWKAASKEQPAWKKVLAVVLIVLVVIAAAVISIVTLGAGASLFAVILVGALVGAVSAGLIQLLNNWSSGEAWHTGLAQAIIMGAIGGAIGGGLGFAAGAASATSALAGRYVVQAVINIGADLVAEGIQQTIGYLAFGQKFNWQGFVMAGVMSGISFRPQGTRPRVGGAATPHVATPRPPTSSTRAAVGQVAGGALVGFGADYLISSIRGEKFDPSKALTAAVSAGVAARASRRAASATPTTPQAPPRTAFGRGLERFRKYDPRGIGKRLEGRIEAAVNRRFGAGPETGAPTPNRARGLEESEAANAPRPHPEGEGGPTRPRDEPDPRRTSTDAAAEKRIPSDAPPIDGVVGRSRPLDIGGEPHALSIRKIGDRRLVILCSNQCGEAILKIQRIMANLDPKSPAFEALQKLATHAAQLDATINNVNPRSPQADIDLADRALTSLRDKMADFHKQHGALDPDVPVPSPTATAPAAPAASGSTASTTRTRVDVDQHLPAGTTTVGSQHIEVGKPVDPKFTKLPDGAEYVYVLQDAVTGEILKVGRTTNITERAGDYALASQHAMGRQLVMDVRIVKGDVGAIETHLRNSVAEGVATQRAAVDKKLGTHPDTQNTPVLPWDATGGRLAGDPWGSGTPGQPGRRPQQSGDSWKLHANAPADLSTMGPNDLYWWRERKWTSAAGRPPPAPARVAPPPAWFKDWNDVAQKYRLHGSLSKTATALGTTTDALKSYMTRNGRSAADLKK